MPTTAEEFGSGVAGVSVAGLVLASQFNTMRTGALYSAGMELTHGYSTAFNHMPAFTRGGAPVYSIGNTFINPQTLEFTKELPAGVKSVPANQATRLTSAADRSLERGAYISGKLGMILPVGMTALLGAQAAYEGGGEALGRFLIEDVFANYYGNRAGENITSVTQADIRKVAGRGDITGLTTAQRYNAPLGSMLLGRTLPVLTAYSGAAMGFSAGQTIGEGLSTVLFGDESKAMGLAGGILGASGGARLGAFLGSSPYGFAAAVGLTVAGSLITSAVGDVLKGGFQNPRSRGLDFAGDLATFNTNSAVTMRQRALQSMHKSHLNARSALGQEASFMHMNRDYFANYRRF